jgi:hypothetical protein
MDERGAAASSWLYARGAGAGVGASPGDAPKPYLRVDGPTPAEPAELQWWPRRCCGGAGGVVWVTPCLLPCWF